MKTKEIFNSKLEHSKFLKYILSFEGQWQVISIFFFFKHIFVLKSVNHIEKH